MVALFFQLQLKLYIFPLPLPLLLLLGSLGGVPLDLVWYADKPECTNQPLRMKIIKERKPKGNQVRKTELGIAMGRGGVGLTKPTKIFNPPSPA